MDAAAPATVTAHACDLCGSLDAHILPEASLFGSGGVWVCASCGFIFVRGRRSSDEIAKAWDAIYGEGYTAKWPAVHARLEYVAEWFEQRKSWVGKHVLEIGAGEGRFLDIVKARGAAACAAIEPFHENIAKLDARGFTTFHGTAEQAAARPHSYFDVVCILWTLENCQDCIRMLEIARDYLTVGGSVIVATGSRIMVPFKKPLSKYFSQNPPDTHCFRFSAKSLSRALQKVGFNYIEFNPYEEMDWMIAEAKITKHPDLVYTAHDDPKTILDYFDAWRTLFP